MALTFKSIRPQQVDDLLSLRSFTRNSQLDGWLSCVNRTKRFNELQRAFQVFEPRGKAKYHRSLGCGRNMQTVTHFMRDERHDAGKGDVWQCLIGFLSQSRREHRDLRTQRQHRSEP